MNYGYTRLEHVNAGAVIKVTLAGDEANVRLVDETNYRRFRARERHEYVGGLARQSPIHLTVPSAGTWYVIVDHGGYAGRTQFNVEVYAN